MATLVLNWIRCDNLAPEQSLSVQPLFLREPLGSPVAVTSSNPLVPLNVGTSFDLLSDFIELQVDGSTIFASEDYIWDTDVADKDTSFVLVYSPVDVNVDYTLTVHYQLNINFFQLLSSTIRGIALKLFLFARSLLTLVFNPPRKVTLPEEGQVPVKDDSKNKSEIK